MALLKTGALLSITLGTSAHNIDTESRYDNFADTPYDLTAPVQVKWNSQEGSWDVDASGADTLQSSATTSRAIFAHLEKNEVDLYSALIDPSDQVDHEKWVEALTTAGLTNGLANMMAANQLTAVIASPLPPACANTKNDYPSIALAIPTSLATGPSFPGDPFALSCVTNESVPGYTPRPGYCVVSIEHNIPSDNRVIFEEPHTGASWFLPTGCVLSPSGGPICNGAPGISAFLPNSLPGFVDGYEIELVVWDPTGKKIDYTLNSGVREDVDGAEGPYLVIAQDHDLENAIANNNWVKDFTGGCEPVDELV